MKTPTHPPSFGSYPQPEWLIDRARLAGPPSALAWRARELWRIAPELLQEGAGRRHDFWRSKHKKTAGIDIITDGEMRREKLLESVCKPALDGVDIDNPGSALDRSGHPNPVSASHRQNPAPARR